MPAARYRNRAPAVKKSLRRRQRNRRVFAMDEAREIKDPFKNPSAIFPVAPHETPGPGPGSIVQP